MAAEDGAVLGILFAKIQHKYQIPEILRLYESLRKPRTTRIVECSTEMQNVFNLPDGEAQRERDRQFIHERPFEGHPNRWADPVFQEWLLGYDVEEEVERAWEVYGKETAERVEGHAVVKNIGTHKIGESILRPGKILPTSLLRYSQKSILR